MIIAHCSAVNSLYCFFFLLLFGKTEDLSICMRVHLNVCVIHKDAERKHIDIIFICKPLAVSLANAHSYKWTALFTFCVSPEDCWKYNCTNLAQKKKSLWSYDRTVTLPTSHIITVSVCSHWFLSLSEPAGCECLAHNETGKIRALDSRWSAVGC